MTLINTGVTQAGAFTCMHKLSQRHKYNRNLKCYSNGKILQLICDKFINR